MSSFPLSPEFQDAIALQYHLSDAEQEVVWPALDGQSTNAIAAHLNISAVAVRKRLGEVYKKIGIQGNGPGKLAELKQRLWNDYQQTALSRPMAPVLPRQDWGEVIEDTSLFYGRDEELRCLIDWVVQDQCRLVALFGMGGIGKTALALNLAESIKDKFDLVIWRSLINTPPLGDLLADIILFLSQGTEYDLPAPVSDRITRLLDYLRQYRCLLILDNVESILKGDTLTGHYREGYDNYSEFLERVAVGRRGDDHQSSLVLTSREKLPEVAAHEGQHRQVRSLHVVGLNVLQAQELLRMKKLVGSEAEQRRLVNRYIGNPLALKVAATTIQELFQGNIAQFLEQSTIIFGGIRNLLDQQFNRLSPPERTVMYWLAINRDEQLSLSELLRDIWPLMAQTDLMDVLESLDRRSLIEKNAGLFSLHPIVLDYTTERWVAQVCEELAGDIADWVDAPTPGNPALPLFKSHALIKAQTKDYVRDSQIRVILQPLKHRLIAMLGSEDALEQQLHQVRTALQGKPPLKVGYAGGNLFNLVCQLKSELNQDDFSRLVIWQGYLKGVTLHRVNFAHCSFHKSVFTETFGSILSVAFNPDGDLLATGDTKGGIRVWQVADSEQRFKIDGHAGWVRAIAFHPNGRSLLSCSDDGTLKLWDLTTERCIRTLQGHTSGVRTIAFNQDGSQIASGGSDHTIRIWNGQTGACEQTLSAHHHWIRTVAISPSGRFLISGSSDKIVRLWDLTTGACVASLPGHTRSLRSVAFSPTGNLFASASSDHTIRLWDLETRRCLRTLSDHSGRVWAVAFSPDGQTLVSGSDDQTVKHWQVHSGQCLKTFRGHHSRVWSVAFSSDGQTVASGSDDQTVKLWDIDSNHYPNQCLQTIQGYARSLRSVAFSPLFRSGSPEQPWLASGSDDQTVVLWNAITGQPVRSLQGHTSRIWSVAFSPDGQTLASGSDDQTVRLWDVTTGQCLNILQDHTNWVRTVAFSHDGTWIASGSDDNTVKIWELPSGRCLKTLKGHHAWVWSVTFSPTSLLLASCGNDQTVRIWDVTSGDCMHVLKGHENWVRAVAFSPDGAILASCSGDRTVRLWDATTGTSLNQVKCKSRVRSLAFSLDGQSLVCGAEDKSIEQWDIPKQELVRTFQGHSDWVRSLSVSIDGKTLASGSKDETIRLWDMATGECLQILRPLRPYEGVNITGVTGLSDAQKSTLIALGAVDTLATERSVESAGDGSARWPG